LRYDNTDGYLGHATERYGIKAGFRPDFDVDLGRLLTFLQHNLAEFSVETLNLAS
jgi:hypothetical protein